MPKMRSMRRMFAILVISCLLAPGGIAFADQKDARLEILFARLKVTKNAYEALTTENTIWSIWSDANDAELNGMMTTGVAAMDAGDHKYALAAFTEIVERKPEFAEGWNKRATLFYLMERFDESVQDIARALELEPRHFGALSGLGLINGALGRHEAAIGAFEQALKINPHLQGVKEHIDSLEREMRGKNL